MTRVPPWETEEVAMYRRSVRQFIEKEFVPQQARWREQHRPDAESWQAAGRAGLLLPDVPEDYGGGGGTFAHEAVVLEELAAAGVHFGATIQSIVARYVLAYGSEAQKRKWLPAMARGELVASIAMTEPGAGSDLQAIRTSARRDGEHYVVKGAKTFISNARHAGLVCLAVKTDPKASGPRGLSLVMVETSGLAGYSVGRTLEKVGMHGQDTCELFFDDARVPLANLVGPAEGRGFSQMMEQLAYERLSIAVSAVAVAERALALTTQHVKDRSAFGRPLFDLQNTRMKLAECKTEATLGRVFVDDCIARFVAGRLDDASAAMAKYWTTERQCRIVDECVQLHGGYGYMTEYPIARMWADSRVQRIYAGSNEVMKELIAWSL
ncbi:MAG TPA: acyl-CoA dehydrogenase family protein [Burkholderiales bacterium]|nr:acyl-CoA dehydrogenase family protein [Burkholderiales bacterium]